MEKNIARIVPIEEIEKSINISENFKKCFSTADGVILKEVNIIGKVIGYTKNKKEYMRIKDETGECNVKIIQHSQSKNIDEEEVLLIIGFLDFDSQQKYIDPYIIKKIEENTDKRQELRRLEIIDFCNYIYKNSSLFSENKKKYEIALEKKHENKDIENKKSSDIMTKENNFDVNKAEEDKEKKKNMNDNEEITKENIIEIIKQLDVDDKGVSYVDILDKINKEQQETAETIIDSLLDEGLCYEPLAGKIKVL